MLLGDNVGYYESSIAQEGCPADLLVDAVRCSLEAGSLSITYSNCPIPPHFHVPSSSAVASAHAPPYICDIVNVSSGIDTVFSLARLARDAVHFGHEDRDEWTAVRSVRPGEIVSLPNAPEPFQRLESVDPGHVTLYVRWGAGVSNLPTGYVIAAGPYIRPNVGFGAWAKEEKPEDYRLVLDPYIPFAAIPSRGTPSTVALVDRTIWASDFLDLFSKEVLTVAAIDRARALLSVLNPEDPPDSQSRKKIRERDAQARRFGWDRQPWSQIPLVRNDKELSAAISLRCAQQGYRADEAFQRLRRYAQQIGIREHDRSGEPLAIDAVGTAIQKLVDLTPGGLPSYLRRIAKTLPAQRAPRQLPASSSDVLSVGEAATVLGVNRRTIYRWIDLGRLKPAERMPLRVRRADVECIDDEYAPRGRPLYQEVARIRGVAYHTARAWVLRRLMKGVDPERIRREASELGPGRAYETDGTEPNISEFDLLAEIGWSPEEE